MLTRRAFIAASAGVGATWGRPTRAAASRATLNVALRFLIARCAGVPVRPEGWVDEHVSAAQSVFASHGVVLEHTLGAFAPSPCEILTRVDRNRMSRYAGSVNAVDVLVVPRVRDLDVPSYDLMGVHWRAEGRAGRGRRWVFLTARATPPVLAHELGHFFGLPHDPKGGNLMTPGPSSPAWRSPHPPKPFAPVLTEEQVERVRQGVVDWRGSK